jgi:hypothetical protein
MLKVSDKKWQQIYNDLLNRIKSGQYQLGSRFPTVIELCKIYEPSSITVRRACEELKVNGWVTSRGQRGTFVTKPLNEVKIYLCSHEIPVTDTGPPSFLIQRFEEIIRIYRASMRVVVIPVSVKQAMDEPEKIKGPMVTFFSNFIDFNGMEFIVNHKRIAYFQEKFAPLVFGSPDGVYDFHQIRIDRHDAFRRAVHYLTDKGHRRIAYFSPTLNTPGEIDRFSGYLTGMNECGIVTSADLIKTQLAENYKVTDLVVTEFMAQPNPPTALICNCDNRALLALSSCRKRGIKVPQDLAIIGFDNSPDSLKSEPPLTTFASLPNEAGGYIMDYVKLYRINQKTTPLIYNIEPQLIERAST